MEPQDYALLPETEQPRVSFEPGNDTKVMPLHMASAALTWLYANRRQVFGEMMLRGVYAIEPAPAAARGRKPRPGHDGG